MSRHEMDDEDFYQSLLSYLCSSCRTIFDAPREFASHGLFYPKDQDGYRLYHTKATFEQSVAHGCRLCSTIWYSCTDGSDSEDKPWNDWEDLKPDDDLQLCYGFASSAVGGYRYHFCFWRGRDSNIFGQRRLSLEEISGK